MISSIEKPMITVDVVVFTVWHGKLKVILIKRKYSPFKDKWALPGGFIRDGEELLHASARELEEETGVRSVYLEQLYTFGDPRRDPRARVITVAYFALVAPDKIKFRASYDAKEAKLFEVNRLPHLAFDHKKIIIYALTRLRNKIQYTNVAWSLLSQKFTLSEIQELYETIWGRRLDKRNFRKKILSLGLLNVFPSVRRGLRQRPAKLYAFKTRKFVELRRFF